MSKIVVVGGAGFVASHVVDQYLRDHDILVIDDLRTGFLVNLTHAPNVTVLREDINSRVAQAAIRTFEPDIVSHHSAQLSVSKGYTDPVGELDADLITTVRLLQLCREIKSVKHFVFASSACCYAPDGSRRLKPQWTYGAAKLAAEHYVDIYQRYFHTTSLRYGIVFGPREWYGRVLSNFARRASEGKPLIVFGDGSAKRDFVYVKDAAKAHRIATDRTAIGPWDVGSGHAMSVLQLAEFVSQHGGVPWKRENVQPGAQSKEMPGRLRLPDEMQLMKLIPGIMVTETLNTITWEEYFKYACSAPEQWTHNSYRYRV